MHRALVYLVLIFVLFVPAAFAGKHPVPLEPNMDAAKCLECHEDKSKGKVVHAAVSMGCTACHEVRVNRDVTRIKLTQVTTVKLCATCHADKNPAEIKGKVHAPAMRDCQKCHAPHTAEVKNLLLKDSSGSKGENLCLNCHTQGVKVNEKGSRHAALDMGCATCHVTHKTGDASKREFRFHLTKDAPGLCADCHDPAGADLAKKHNNQPIATADCLECHDPHESASPKLMQTFVHSPFEGGAASCEACHQAPSKEGKVVLTQANSKELCVSCHADKPEQIEKAKVPHAGAMGDCTDCHGAHTGKAQGFPKPDAVNVCLKCHDAQSQQMQKKHLHKAAFEQGCAVCHEPHGSENAKLLRTKTVNSLCLECHGPDSRPQPIQGSHLVTIFGGKVKLPAASFRKTVILPLKYGRGHPTDKHPVADQMDPNDVTKVRTPLNCGTCHQPHASAQPGLLANDQANNMAFCASCHKDLGK